MGSILSKEDIKKGDTSVETFEHLFGREEKIKEEKELQENCQSTLYKFAHFSINLLIRLSSLKLVPEKELGVSLQSHEKQTLNNHLKFHNLCSRRKNGNGELVSQIGRVIFLLWYLVIFLATIKLVIIGLIHLEHDRFKLLAKQSISNNATQNEKCILANDYKSESTRRHDQLKKWLYYIGDPIMNLVGTGTMAFGIPPSFTINFFLLGGIYMHFKGARADQCCFILDPLGERCRIRRAVADLIRDLNVAFKNSTKFFELEITDFEIQEQSRDSTKAHSRVRSRQILPAIRGANLKKRVLIMDAAIKFSKFRSSPSSMGVGELNKGDPPLKCLKQLVGANDTGLHKSLLDALELSTKNNLSAAKTGNYHSLQSNQMSRLQLKLLLDDDLPDHVRPAYLNPNWHKQFMYVWGVFIIPFSIGGWFEYLGVYGGLTSAELYTRANHRVELLSCKQWNSDAIPKENFYIPSFEKLSTQDQQAYLSYFNGTSTKSILNLAWTVEWKYFLTPSIILTYFDSFILCMFICFWINFYLELYIEATEEKTIWLKQIEHQVEFCADLMSEYRCSYDYKQGKEPTAQAEAHVAKAILVSYLNYELFRRQHMAFKNPTSFFVGQALMLGLCMWGCGYLVGNYIGAQEKSMILFLASYLPAIANIYLLNGARISARSKSIMKKITRLLANAALNSVENSFVIEIWRRQILFEKEIDLHYSLVTWFIGPSIDYGSILTFNGYVAGLLLLFLKNWL